MEISRWPIEAIDPAEVRGWISDALPAHPEVRGPMAVHRANPWGVTARFATTGASTVEEVVFKASFLPRSFTGPEIVALLSRMCPGDVPHVLAWIDRPGRRWTVYQTFTGTLAGSSGQLESLVAIARTMARIQARVASAAPAELAGVPRLTAAQLPDCFAALLQEIPRSCLATWQREETGSRVPPDVLDRLRDFRPRVQAWAAALSAEGWPLTIHHVDLHPDNAVIQPHGGILIYDWEEADLGPPFFSLDKLLLAAADLTGGGSAVPASAHAAAVRAAYLDALPWRTRAERERAFDLGLLLAPIRAACGDLRFARAMGWSPAEPLARWISLALQRWENAEG